MGKPTFIVVAPSKFNNESGILFRRNKFANYLLENDFKVIWIYKNVIRPWNENHYRGCIKDLDESLQKIDSDSDFIEVPVPDPIPSSLCLYLKPLQYPFLYKINRALKNIENKVLWYTYPAYYSFIDIGDWEKVVYDRSDNWAGTKKEGIKSLRKKLVKSLVRRSENYIIRKSNVVYASSKYLAEDACRINDNVNLIENGVYVEEFIRAKPNSNFNIKSPSFGFVGGMKSKIDFDLVNYIAKNKSEWNIVLIGPNKLKDDIDEESFQETIQQSNVEWLGGVEPDEVPGFLKKIDVGLLPYKRVSYNNGVFPLKFYEYLASDMPIVGCGLPSTKQFVEKGVYAYEADGDHENFLSKCEEALNWIGNSEFKELRRVRAMEGDWNDKFKFMVNGVLNEEKL